jgi:hypothetical protein
MASLTLFLKRNGEQLTNSPVVCRYKKNWSEEEVTEKTDDGGKVHFNIPTDELLAVEAGGVVIKNDWYIGNNKEEYFDVPDPTEDPNIYVHPAKGWHLIKVRVNYQDDNQPVANQPVTFITPGGMFSKGREIKTETNPDGWVRINIEEDEIEEINVLGRKIKENWYVGNVEQTEEYLQLSRAGKGVEEGGMDLIYQIEGQLYYFDGTQPYQEIEVIVEANGLEEIRAKQFSDSKGKFVIDLPKELPKKFLFEFDWFVAGEKVDKKRVHFFNNFATIILPDINFIGKNGLEGGVVTGRVVDSSGQGIDNMRVSARVATSSIVPGIFNTNYVETKSNKYGYFALGFSKGTEIEEVLVEGNPPKRIYKKVFNDHTGEKAERDLPTKGRFRAGSFNLQLESDWKMFGSF